MSVAANKITGSQRPPTAAPDEPRPSPLPQGIQEYVDLFRTAQNGDPAVNAARLRADMGAHALNAPAGVQLRTFTTFITLEGRELAVKIYQPGKETRRPGVCYFHGGGFIFGSLESFDSVAAGLAETTGATVASVQYRRLPENRYADAQEDCYAALLWLRRHAGDLNVDPSRLCVAGDSVGALFATTAAMQARDRGGPAIACQILMYGAFALESGRPAYALSKDPLLTAERVENFIELYRRAQDPDRPFAPPLSGVDLHGLPPALILAAERDPLCDESLEYAQALKASGVAAETVVAAGMIHGFIRARAMSPAAGEELSRLAAKARHYLWPDDPAETGKGTAS